MPLKARVTRRAFWSRKITYHYECSYLMCEQDAVGAWIVVDTRKPDRRLAGPFSRINQAKVAAGRLVDENPKLRVVLT